MTVRARIGLVGLVLVALAGCGGKDPKPALMTPNSRLIYHDTEGHALWSFCDRGSRVYLTQSGNFWVVPNGCLSGEP